MNIKNTENRIKNFLSILLFGSSLFMGSFAYGGHLVCEYDGIETTISYNYNADLLPEKNFVAPGILAYTQSCDGAVCDLIFETWAGETTHELHKLKRNVYSLSDAEGDILICEDTEAAKIKKETKRVADQAERAAEIAVDQAKRAAEVAADQSRRAAKKAQDDIDEAARKVEKALKKLF